MTVEYRRPHRRALLGTLLLLAVPATSRAETVESHWLTPSDGNWHDGSRWSSAPDFPRNGQPGQTTYRVTIDPPNPQGYTFYVHVPDRYSPPPYTIDALTLASPQATLYVTDGLTILGDLTIAGGKFWHSSYANGPSITAGRVVVTGGSAFFDVAPLLTQSIEVSGGAAEIRSTLTGATISGSGGTLDLGSATLDGVTLARPASVSFTKVRNGLTLVDANLDLAGSLTFSGSQQLSGRGTLTMNVGGLGVSTGDKLTIGPDVAIRTGSTGGFLGPGIITHGLVSARKSVYLNGATLLGTVEARDGASIAGTPGNFDPVSKTLTGGKWNVYANSTIELGPGPFPSIRTNDAEIHAIGANTKYTSSFPGLTSLLLNRGKLAVSEGGTLSVGQHSMPWNNQGVVVVGPGSTLASGLFTTSGTFHVAGKLSLSIQFGLPKPVTLPTGIQWEPGAVLEVIGQGPLVFNSDFGEDVTLVPSSYNPPNYQFDADQHLQALTIGQYAYAELNGPNRFVRTRILSITTKDYARLDVKVGAIILDKESTTVDAAFTEVRALVASGRNGFSPGIGSSVAPANRSVFGLATLLNRTPSGQPILSEYMGEPLDATDVIVAYALNGDSDLSGHIDADDYARLDRGFLMQAADPATYLTYRYGDIDYNNAINLDDYALIDAAFLYQSSAPAVPLPEPAAFAALPAAFAMLSRRRRR